MASNKNEMLQIAEGKSAGVEIDPTPRGIIFSPLGLPGGAKIQKNPKKIQKIWKISKKQNIPLTPIGECREYWLHF